MIEQLRQATRQQHADLDHAVYPIIQSVRTTDDYAQLLRVFYGYFKPVYDKLDLFIDTTILRDYHLRRKPSIILEDLQSIGITDTKITLCHTIPSMQSAAQAFGAMYVLEGSTMGGKIISKKLSENTGLDDKSFRFFTAYGEFNGQMWGIFAESLQQSTLAGFSAEITDTAITTFRYFHHWINAQYPGTKAVHKELQA